MASQGTGVRADGAGLGILVGLKAEARVARAAFPAAAIAISGATAQGARDGARRLVEAGTRGLLSFGLAAGLDPALPPGTVVVADRVAFLTGEALSTDPALSALFGEVSGGVLHSDVVVARADDKASLFRRSGCCALDMESGFVARSACTAGLPFAVLRVICDPADRTLPDAALVVLDPEGGLKPGRLLGRLARDPRQIAGLIALGRDAASARRAMGAFLSARMS
ncbi:hypothetical protein AA103196_2757 [Ameyamaea chiangmaiensis NBRC 103196]|uniref:Nucleoside phosphorylase domain-containing protein n=1 Tax=Ameyamaea chiangmaiensis TaxID=442969 RepID=A0A850PGV3_9PROT|nr:hypothetical protein [Ameyamaea chiangmaiensis]MBS4074248.1 hypothetical protein [Ameyamaea chiangmaiensis]NVN41466.1 hypothetical protein [Ameyamaea chiangmaiensis]GBQ71372.1 hypothetical protein AA103196_2757 [Ameyamaea chiangmaiensis NBRC 103196]